MFALIILSSKPFGCLRLTAGSGYFICVTDVSRILKNTLAPVVKYHRIFVVSGSDDEVSETEDNRTGPSEPDSEQGAGTNSSVGSSHGKTRRRRTAFTSEQLLELEREFHAKKYLSLTERSQIASALKLSEVQVSTGNLIFRRNEKTLFITEVYIRLSLSFFTLYHNGGQIFYKNM